jgi:hypothetical protein
MTFVPTISALELAKTSDEIIENGVILEPELPPEILADQLIEQADPEFIAELGRSLIVGQWTKKIRAVRAANAEKKIRERPKGFEHLPLRIRIYGGKTIAWFKANATQLDQFCSIRSGQHKGRKKDDLALQEGRKLRDRLRRQPRGTTAGELLGFE